MAPVTAPAAAGNFHRVSRQSRLIFGDACPTLTYLSGRTLIVAT
jgi:hypothetical protein